jgi:nucleotide-binding universal stress UspA family protein
MLKSILASLTGFASDRSVLDAAFALARIDQGHVAALHTRIDPGDAAAAIGVSQPQMRSEFMDAMQRIAREERERSSNAQNSFAEACKRHCAVTEALGPGVTGSYREMTTFENETLHQARLHDVIVTARVPELSSESLHTLIMLAGKPVLIAPQRPARTTGETVAIAWKDGAEAARAVTAALPILERAKRAIVISVSEDASRTAPDRVSAEGVVAQLKRHGVDARLDCGTSGPVSAAAKIKEICYAEDADLLVSGAYGHSRVREMVFGGVTRDLLAACDIPLLMVH